MKKEDFLNLPILVPKVKQSSYPIRLQCSIKSITHTVAGTILSYI